MMRSIGIQGNYLFNPKKREMPQSADPSDDATSPEEQLQELTPRQIEVLRLVAQGLSYKEVAQALFVTEHTVKYHIAEVMNRLQVKHRREAIAYARRAGLIPDEPSE